MNLKRQKLIYCKCGCGEKILKYNKWGKERSYKNYHQNVGKKRSKQFCLLQSKRAKKKGWKPPEQKDYKGAKHWNWKGGISTMNAVARNNSDHSKWAKQILKKDNYICFKCGQEGQKVGNLLNAHHLLNWCDNPDYRFNTENGICLCKNCHIKLHKRLKVIAYDTNN